MIIIACNTASARAVNCLEPKDGEPCNECEICKDNGYILDGYPRNVDQAIIYDDLLKEYDLIKIEEYINKKEGNLEDIIDELESNPYLIDEI